MEKLRERLKRWVTGFAKAAAAIRMNQSGMPSNPMAVGFMVSGILKTRHSVNGSRSWGLYV